MLSAIKGTPVIYALDGILFRGSIFVPDRAIYWTFSAERDMMDMSIRKEDGR